MKVYQPKISVKLVKASPRAELVEGLAAADRVSGVAAINLTPLLGDNCTVQTVKTVRETTGGFTITVTDKAHGEAGNADTVYGLVEPMDLVEIRFCHDPSEYGGTPPVVMRGFVSEVTRNESMSNGTPQRTVTISGQDMGKILQIIQIFYLNNSVVGENILSTLAFFHKYAEAGDGKIKPANDFLQQVMGDIVNPYLAELVSLADGSSVGATVINSWTVNADIEGTVSPYAMASFNNVSLEAMLQQLLDVGPFNELFVEDLEDTVQIRLRPTPFLDVSGNPIQGSVETVSVDIEDVVSAGITRTDAGVANYYWVTDNRWTLMGNEDAKLAASMGPEDSYIYFKYLNSQSRLYGFRKMEVQTMLGPPDISNSDAAKEPEVKDGVVNPLGGWLAQRRKLLADCNKDNVLLEHGSLQLRGNERIKAGRKLVLNRGSGAAISAYVAQVTHEFHTFGTFTTSVMLERGNGFVERAKSAASLYYTEQNMRGVQ